MAKRKSDAGEEESKDKKPPSPKRRPIKVTLESDPAISTDHAKIDGLLSQGKSWREIANYYPDHNADTIKKRYQLCNRVLMETFSDDDDTKLREFLERYEKNKYIAAGKELAKSVVGVKKRVKALGLDGK